MRSKQSLETETRAIVDHNGGGAYTEQTTEGAQSVELRIGREGSTITIRVGPGAMSIYHRAWDENQSEGVVMTFDDLVGIAKLAEGRIAIDWSRVKANAIREGLR